VISETPRDEQTTWWPRPVVLLAAAYMIVIVVHESAHALAAYAFNLPFTLFHFGVILPRDAGTRMQLAAIAVAGPLSSLLIGLLCWFCYRRARGLRSELLWLYFTTFGLGGFVGNLMSTAFVGDFGRVAINLRVPLVARYAASITGFVLVSAIHFMVGWELHRLSPTGSSRLRSLIVMVVIPLVAGTAIVTLSSIPIPSALVFGRFAETSFWVFAAVGLLMSRRTSSGTSQTLQLSWADMAMLATAVIAVRILAGGIAFQQ